MRLRSRMSSELRKHVPEHVREALRRSLAIPPRASSHGRCCWSGGLRGSLRPHERRDGLLPPSPQSRCANRTRHSSWNRSAAPAAPALADQHRSRLPAPWRSRWLGSRSLLPQMVVTSSTKRSVHSASTCKAGWQRRCAVAGAFALGVGEQLFVRGSDNGFHKRAMSPRAGA